MNLVDAAVIVMVLASTLRGYRRGLVSQVFELGGGFLGLVVGLGLGPNVASAFTDRAGLQAALISLGVVFVLLAIGQATGVVVGHHVHAAARDPNLRKINTGTGVMFSVVVTLLAFWLVGSLLLQGPSRWLARELRRSTLLSAINQALPEPPNVLAYIQQYLNTSGFPQVFAGLPRDVGPAVDLPSNRVARRASRLAGGSVVRVRVPACGGVQLGSGWIAAPSRVVTNAHVVAGGDRIFIQDSTGERAGSVVVFDKDTDVAVVKVDGLGGSPLALNTEVQSSGTPGATLGYPGGGDGQLVVHRAAVQAQFQAVGRDIYGRSKVERDIYEVRSPVRQGDSGGPFVLPSGEVAGVIFAASTTDTRVGYALTGREVEDEIETGARRERPVGTGSCTR